MFERSSLAVSALVIAALTGCTANPTPKPSEPPALAIEPTESESEDSAAEETEAPAAKPVPELTPVPALTSLYGDYPAFAATAKTRAVAVFDKPGGNQLRKLAHPQPSGAPLTFLVKNLRGRDWLEVYLPVRPNGSSGWVRASEVAVSALLYRVDVHLSEHRLVLYERGKVREEYPVGIGTENTPTPGGIFYLKELLKPTNKDGFYGPFAYGLSGFSNVLTKFGAGEGVIGIHGTNDESSIGKDVSSGCVRMYNDDITAVAKLLPLGTPVRILA